MTTDPATTTAPPPVPAELTTPSGLPLTAWWHAASGPDAGRGVAVMAPGVAVPSRMMRPLAEATAARGWEVLRLEFPGIGDSPVGPREVPGGLEHWGSRDLDTALRAAADRADDRPLVFVGHSAGAWLVGLTTTAVRVDAVLAIASMSGAWRGLKRRSWPQVVPAMTAIIPLLSSLLGYLPSWAGLGEDAPGGAMRQWAAWCRQPGFLFDDPDVRHHYDLLTAPVHVLLPTDDAWASTGSVHALWDHAANTRHELVQVDPTDHDGRPIGHIGLLRDRFASLWDEQLAWLEDAADAHAASR